MYYLLMNGYKLKPVYFSMEEVLDNYVNIKEINKVEVEKDLIKLYVYHFNMYIDKQSKSYIVEATSIPYQSGKFSNMIRILMFYWIWQIKIIGQNKELKIYKIILMYENTLL